VVGLGGRVHGPAGLENQMGGGISGTAVVDLATGQAVDADIKISFDATAGQQTKNTGSLEVRLQRSGL
jgi:hypothetical protein